MIINFLRRFFCRHKYEHILTIYKGAVIPTKKGSLKIAKDIKIKLCSKCLNIKGQ